MPASKIGTRDLAKDRPLVRNFPEGLPILAVSVPGGERIVFDPRDAAQGVRMRAESGGLRYVAGGTSLYACVRAGIGSRTLEWLPLDPVRVPAEARWTRAVVAVGGDLVEFHLAGGVIEDPALCRLEATVLAGALRR